MQTPSDLSGIPFPVAYPLHWARDPEGKLAAGDLRANAIFAAYQAMRLATLLMLADYLDRDDLPKDLEENKLIDKIRGLRFPHWGEWTALADELTRYWSREPQRSKSRFPEVVKGWQRISRVNKSTAKSPPDDAELFPLAQALANTARLAKPRSANQAMQDYRNQRAHREGAVTPDSLNQQRLELESLKPLVEAMVGALFGHGKVQLLRACPGPDDLQVIRLSGAHPTLHFEAESVDRDWEEQLTKTRIAAIVGDEAITIYPLLIPSENGDTSTDALLDPAAMIDGVSDGKLTVMGVRNARIYKWPHDHLTASLKALASKHGDLSLRRGQVTPWALAPWAQMTAELTLDAITGRKYFPEAYLERPDVDGALQRIAHAQGRALLLLGEAGSGKSSLIARLADQLTGHQAGRTRYGGPAAALVSEGERHTDVVAYLSGRADYSATDPSSSGSGNQLLADIVCRKLGVSEGPKEGFVSLEALVGEFVDHATKDLAPNRRFWILLDGLNEADRYIDLLRALDAFLPTLAQAPMVRLVISLRSGAYHALARRDTLLGTHGATVFANSRYFLEFQDENDKAQPWLDVRPFRKATEGPAAYALRQAHPPAAPIPWAQLDASLQDLLLTPLYLYLFHKTWAGKVDIPRQLNEADLLDAYLDSLTGANPETDMAIAGSKNWLQRLGDLMLQTRRPFLSLAIAESWVQDWLQANRFSSAQAVSKLDPIEELVSANVLLRPAEEGIGLDRNLVGYQFAQQKLAERIILRALDRRIAPETLPSRQIFSQFAALAAEDPPFWELAGALTTWVERLTMAGEGDCLLPMLDIEHDGIRLQLLRPFIFTSCYASPENAEKCLSALGCAALGMPDGGERYLASSVIPVTFELDMKGTSVSSKRRLNKAFFELSSAFAALEPHDTICLTFPWIFCRQLAYLAEAAGDSRDAGRWLEEGYATTARLANFNPDNILYQREHMSYCERLGKLALASGNDEDARRWFEEGHAIADRLVVIAPDNIEYLRNISISCNHLGDLAEAAGDNPVAHRWFEEGYSKTARLANLDPDNTLYHRAQLFYSERLGELALAAGDSEDARRWFEEGHAIRVQLAALNLDNTEYQRDLSISCSILGLLAQATGDDRDASRWFERGYAIAERLVTDDPKNSDYQVLIALSRTRLDRLL